MRPLVLALLLVGLASCSQKLGYTYRVQEEFDLEESDLKRVQFYTSGDVVLYTTESQGSKKTEGGELVVSRSKQEDVVTIPMNTRGVLERMEGSDELVVRFEQGAGNVLRFKARSDRGGHFYLSAKKWENGKGTLEYGGKEYTCTKGSGDVYLMVSMRNLNKTKRSERVAKGVKIR